MKYFFIVLLTIAVEARATILMPSKFSFRYSINDGTGSIDCTHKQVKDLPDWTVNCGKKEFSVHFLIREYQRTGSAPMTAYEILYWITERSSSPMPVFHSMTQWIRLKEKTSFDSLTVSQGVENDYAFLELQFSL